MTRLFSFSKMMSVQRLHQPSTDEIDCVKFITISKATNEKSKYEALWLEDLSFTEVKLFYRQWNFETDQLNEKQIDSCSMLIFFAISLCYSHINILGPHYVSIWQSHSLIPNHCVHWEGLSGKLRWIFATDTYLSFNWNHQKPDPTLIGFILWITALFLILILLFY